MFFPSMLAIAPGESRKLRVGTNVLPGAQERTYRIFVEELPPLVQHETPTAVRVLTKMGIPIFVGPANATAAPRVEGLGVQQQHVKFTMRNAGTRHFVAHKVRVIAKGAKGDVVFNQEVPGWYILAGGARLYDVEVPKAACASVRSVRVEIEIDPAQPPIVASLDDGRCVP